jgi:hypothetical protein
MSLPSLIDRRSSGTTRVDNAIVHQVGLSKPSSLGPNSVDGFDPSHFATVGVDEAPPNP